MTFSIGTRSQQNFRKERIDNAGAGDTRSHTRDSGMSKNVTAALTFAAGPPGTITGANGTFANTFALGDPILVQGTNLNNGFKTVTGLDGVNNAYLQVDPPCEAEGPLNATVRTA